MILVDQHRRMIQPRLIPANILMPHPCVGILPENQELVKLITCVFPVDNLLISVEKLLITCG